MMRLLRYVVLCTALFLCANEQDVYAIAGSGTDLNFDGSNDYVDLNSHASTVIFNAPATIEFWLKAEFDHKSSGGVVYSVSDGNGLGSGENFVIAYGSYDGTVSNERITIAHNEGSSTTAYHLIDPVGSYTQTWHHYAITCSGSAFQLYIDGVLQSLTANPGNSGSFAGDYGENISTSSKVTFGAEELSSVGNHFDGDIDELRLWNVVLTQTEVRDWMCRKETSSHPQHANIVGYWKFDDAFGSTLTDGAGSSLNGTLTNFALTGLSSNWLTSGAAVGDQSTYTYTVTDTLALSHPNGDSLYILGLNTTPVGAHIYYVDESPTITTAPTNYDSIATKRYWGVFPIGSSLTNYTMVYMYNNFPTTGDVDARRLLFRNTNADPTWKNTGATHVELATAFVRPLQFGNREYTIGYRSNSTHDNPGPSYCLDFDGTDDQITLGNSSSFDYSTGCSIEAWIRPNSPSADGYIVSKSGQYQLILESDRTLTFRIRKSDNSDWQSVTTSATIPDGGWAHVAGTFNGSVIQAYINGESKASSSSYTGSIYTAGGGDVFIGSSGGADYFVGNIDEVRMWSAEVPQTAIQRWACRKLAVSHTIIPYLTAYYRFDKTTGSVCEDLNGSNDGTLQNMTNGDWVTSSAVLGDQSSYDYSSPSQVSHAFIDATGTTRDSLYVDVTGGSPTGVQVVVVGESPNVTTAPGDLAALEVKYWEVMMIGGTDPTYTVTYQYGPNPLLADENKVMLARRDSAGAAAWTVFNATIDKTANTISKTSETDGAQYILGTAVCNWQEWTGLASTAWSLAGNWCGDIPSSTISASIPNPILSGNSPVISSSVDVYDLSIASGSTLTNNSTLNIYGDVTATGTLSGNGTSSVIYKGSASQTISGAITYDYLEINSTADITVTSGEQRVVDSLKIAAGTLNAAGLVTLQSDASQTARLCKVEGTLSGDMNCELYLPDGIGWRFFSSPISDGTFEDMKDDIWFTGFTGSHYPTQNVNVYTYDEDSTGSSINGYRTPTDITNDLEVGQGYQVYVNPVEVTVDWNGSVNTGDVGLPVSYTTSGGASEDGWCFIGNPYPSVINWDATEWTKTNMDDAVYMYDAEGKVYATYISGVGSNGGTKYIPAYNSFWVKANASSPVLTVTEDCKANQTTDFWKTTLKSNDLMRFKLTNGSYTDETVLRLHPLGTPEFDAQLDAVKMYSGAKEVPELALVDDSGDEYSINSISQETFTSASINVNIKEEGWHTLNVDFEGNQLAGACTELKDLKTQTVMPLNQPISYDFYVDGATVSEQFIVQKAANAPQASFDLTLDGEQISLQNHSSNATSFTWDFGDGQTSNKIIPTHAYENPGTYIITLEATNGTCKSVQQLEVEVTSELATTNSTIAEENQVSWFDQTSQLTAVLGHEWAQSQYNIVDVQGRIVQQGMAGTSIEVDKSLLGAGLYIVQVTSPSGKQMQHKWINR